MSFPFYYSQLNYDLAQSTPASSLNIFWNQLNEKMKANSIMYMTPVFDPSIGFQYPEYGMWGNNLLNPMLAIQQTMQSFQNGSWMNGMNGGNWFNNMQWGNWPWGGSNNNNSDGSGGSSSVGTTEYNDLKSLITKYRDKYANSMSGTMKDKIKDALNKSGKTEEKLQALKDVYKVLDKTKLENIILELPEYRNSLSTAGYKFPAAIKDDDATNTAKLLNNAKKEIEENKVDIITNIVQSKNDPQILKVISLWNDKFNGDDDRSIIRLIAKHIPEGKTPDDNSLKGPQKEVVEKLGMSLVNAAEDFKSKVDGDFPELDAAVKELSDAVSNATGSLDQFTEGNVEAIAPKFEKLYAMLRIMEAERVRNEIKSKYSFLNDISANDRDIVTDDLIVKSTKADLKDEGISVDGLKLDEIQEEKIDDIEEDDEDYSDCESAEDAIERLTKEGKEKITETAKEGVYKTKETNTNEPPKFYTIKDDKLVELKGVKDIDKDGKCKMLDGSADKPMNEVKTEEVTAQNIADYNNTLKRINDLTTKGKIRKCPTDLSKSANWQKGLTLYWSIGQTKDAHCQCFVIRNNKLMQINGYVKGNGMVHLENGSEKKYSELTDSDFLDISPADIITEDLHAKDAQEKRAEAKRLSDEKVKQANEKAAAEDAKFVNEYNPPEQQASGIKLGNDIADKLMRNTDDDMWTDVKRYIDKITEDNVHDVISAYAAKEGAGSDNILEQIATEQECTGLFGTEWGQEKRPARERLKMINHIIKAVLDHCKKYNAQSESAYKNLEKAYKKGITEDDINNKAETDIRKLDEYILKLVKREVTET